MGNRPLSDASRPATPALKGRCLYSRSVFTRCLCADDGRRNQIFWIIVRFLLDTCTFLWLASNPGMLSPKAAGQIEIEGNDLFLSMASAWEICLKVGAGKLELTDKPLPWIVERTNYWQINLLNLSLDAVCQSMDLPNHHKDPFDRLLIAQAINNQLTILTPDPLMKKYAVKTLW